MIKKKKSILTARNSVRRLWTIFKVASRKTSQEYEFGSECSVLTRAGAGVSKTSSASSSVSDEISSHSSMESG